MHMQQGYKGSYQQGFPPPQGGPPPQQVGFPPQQGGFPPPQGGFPPPQGGFSPPQGGQPVVVQNGSPNAIHPEQDGSEAENGPPPDLNQFQTYGGYEQVGGFGQMSAMPPPPPPPPPSGPPPHMEFAHVANLNQDEAREAMLAKVAENCCWGKKAAKDMTIAQIDGSTALHYILETYCEGRSTNYEHVPFHGQFIDGPENGPPPPPWAVEVHPDGMFNNHQKKVEVPHTAVVKPCHRCHATGQVQCGRCHGRGQVRCSACGGDGRVTRMRDGERHVQSCHSCGGDGRKRCYTCGGDGRVTCPSCKGHRQLKFYIALTVKFVNHTEDFIMEETDLPDELVRVVKGNLIFEQTMDQVWPVTAYPTKAINDNSIRLVEKHRRCFPSERQLQQRQTIRAIPVTECAYAWKDVNTRFWVYGLDRKVHSPDYPQQCCWGCQIL
ncbi:protein SSUH2 homolog isoform X2 [Lineus longissimus]|uniref:protein SSUH2 homolog isoform X2 n=1 Tax=Lineus longissimus TaxID=88925 RepID=UPI00315DF166